MFSLVLVLVCIFGAAIGQILLKSGMRQIGEISSLRQLFNFNTLFSIFTNLYILAGLFCYVVSMVLWLGVLSRANVSFVYPLASLGYVVTAIAAIFFLKETIVPFQWLGILLVVGGCILILRSG